MSQTRLQRPDSPRALAPSGPDIPGTLRSALATIGRKIDEIATSIYVALRYGIEREVQSILTPQKDAEVMGTYQSNMAKGIDDKIRSQVRAMLSAIQEHFPEYKSGTKEFIHIRYHFFNKIRLWGRTG